VIFVQSVPFLSKRHTHRPSLASVVLGFFVPGICATRYPCGKGSWHICLASPFAMAKREDSSVVAPWSSMDCAATSAGATLNIAVKQRKKVRVSHRTIIIHTW